MRRVVAGVVTVLLLAGCDTPSGPDNGGPAPSSAAASSAPAGAANLGAVCDALKDTVKLPADGTVQYLAEFNDPTGWASNAPICDIEPDGEYEDLALRVPAFGRAEFNYGILTAEQLQQAGYPEYDPGAVQKLLTRDQADALTVEIPCANKPCKDGIHGYQYNFRFETFTGDIAVVAQFDYITTDVSGEQKPQYRVQAIEAFSASMQTIKNTIK